jgi:hypothetical protein
MPTIGWPQLEDAASEIFSVWVGGSELRFAEEAWGHLAKAGLAEAETELEQTQVKIRFIALACVYLDFCAIAKDEDCEPAFDDWAHDLEIDLFRVGQLVGKSDEDCNNAADEYDFQRYAMTVLTDRCRSDLQRALVAGFGNEQTLYSALWHSSHDPEEAADLEDEEWKVTTPNGLGFEFVLNGFRRERSYS